MAAMVNCAAQKAVSMTAAIERQFSKIESDILSSAQAMPEDKFYSRRTALLSPSDFKGARTWQMMELTLYYLPESQRLQDPC